MSTTDNINATISYTVGQALDNYSQAESLDVVLTTLRKHGISPVLFEYEPERDEPQADIKVEVLEEQRDTSYNSADDETTVRLTQRIKGSI
ncbi:hypothetical protein NY537_14770 [Curtobacterium flaccumfaciens pv. betae]|uniref:hypothetical protein n=1 Tax=Curtobacterium flaccumfaciens TaxID=2035 RepID=UPI002658BFBC|nr:hypothetical protein [Curtobacterium flaccumfaciens]MCS5514004.1 hypothetical protein [Curtobacterium flaccumfaciens pv. betae]